MWQDLRFGLRTLAKNPGFAVIAITALALGIGANATVFSLANAILFKTLPFVESERIFYLSTDRNRPDSSSGVSRLEFDELRRQVKSFSGLAAYQPERYNLSDDVSVPDSYSAGRLTANAFSLLGQRLALGRDFAPEDERPGAEPVVILSYGLWERRYGKDASIIGRKIRLDTVPATVIGVAKPGVGLPPEAQLYTALAADGKESRGNRHLTGVGKLAPSASKAAAEAELRGLAVGMAETYPDTNKDIRFLVQGYTELTLNGPVRAVFLVLLGAVGFVLLIACANVANMLLARAVGRAREISIRAALGAGRWRVVRQLLAESLLLSLVGGALGWAIAFIGIRAFDAAVIPTGKPAWIDFSMDYRALSYLAAITLTTALLFGLAPALRLSRMDVNTALKDGGRGASSLRGRYLSGVLVVVEMTLAVVLLTGAGLMIRSFLWAYSRPAGIDTANLLTMALDLPEARYVTPASQLEFQRQVTERLRALPGVKSTAFASNSHGWGNVSMPYEVDGQVVDPSHRPIEQFLLAGDGYFETLGLMPLRGRVLNTADYAGGPFVAVVNETMARQVWPNQDPLGKRFRTQRNNKQGEWMTVVGLIPDVLQSSQNAVHQPTAVIPFRQELRRSLVVLARTRVSAGTLANAFRREVQAVDADLPVRNVFTMEEQLALDRWPLRVFGAMFSIFAGIALLLATVGLYAVVAYGVSQRTQEIGVRVALGASSGSILGMVFRSGIRQAGIGLGLGLLAAVGVSRVLSNVLVGVSATDPVTFGLVGALLLSAAILGCAIPARRAMRVDPAIALRHE